MNKYNYADKYIIHNFLPKLRNVLRSYIHIYYEVYIYIHYNSRHSINYDRLIQ